MGNLNNLLFKRSVIITEGVSLAGTVYWRGMYMSTLQRPRLLPKFSSLLFNKVREELGLFVPELLHYTNGSPLAHVLSLCKINQDKYIYLK